MPADPKNLDAVPVGRIFLQLTNPRHEPFGAEGQAIEYLCANEDVYPLAKDIAKGGWPSRPKLAQPVKDERSRQFH
jgi:hypothetical protein